MGLTGPSEGTRFPIDNDSLSDISFECISSFFMASFTVFIYAECSLPVMTCATILALPHVIHRSPVAYLGYGVELMAFSAF